MRRTDSPAAVPRRRRALRKNPKPTAVYAWTTGQDFNIGDSLLRRPYLRQLAELGQLHVCVRNASPSYLTNLGIDEVTHYRSAVRWYGALIVSTLRRRTVLAYNAGETTPTAHRACLMVFLMSGSLVCRWRGGASVWLGASVQPTRSRMLLSVYRLAARTATMVRWREAGSSAVVASHPVGPDWAFVEGTPVEEWRRDGRGVLAFVLRGDRDLPSRQWCEWSRKLCAALGLRPVFVVQVRSDAERAVQMTHILGGDVIDWPATATHAEQEQRVRAVYRRATLVIGDRLHGLIIGATEGAVPIGWVESSRGKVAAHFDAIGLSYVGRHEGSRFDSRSELRREHLELFTQQLAARMATSREQLTATQEVLRAL
jgi:hypothetical protein